MVRVEVQDKTAATIECLDNITLECPAIFDVNNLSLQFGMPTVVDDCAENIDIEELDPIVNIDNCGLGTIRRRFRADDGQGGTLQCTQVIRVVNNSPFTEDDITFPLDLTTATMCDTTEVLPDNLPPGYDFPVVNEDACDLVGFDFEDQVFVFSNDPNSCFKVLRTWTVIDWCQRDENDLFLRWTHVQEIKINNNVAPMIDAVQDSLESEVITIASDSLGNCLGAEVPLVLRATDDCIANTPLNFSYEINAFDPETMSFTAFLRDGTGADATDVFDVGMYRIEWVVFDGCGNSVEFIHDFEVINNKPPTAICLDGVSTSLTLMDTDGDNVPDSLMAIIWASDFNQGSFHACYPDSTLTIEIESAGSTTPGIFNDSLAFTVPGENIPVTLQVTDQNGNTSICTTHLRVDDNELREYADVQGEVITEDEQEVEGVMVHLEGSPESEETDVVGMYAFEDMPTGGAYTVNPRKDNDVMNGVSTLDLVLIQKHILQTQLLNSPYKQIAADINHDESISAIDLIQLRKLILGVYEEFPSNDSWRFVDAIYEFPIGIDPLQIYYPEEYEISNLDNNMWINFIGVKIGDVNGSVTPNITSNIADRRSDKTLNLGYKDVILEEGRVEVEISADNFTSISGMQFTLEHNGLSVDKVEAGLLEITEANIGNLEEGVSTLSWNRTDGESMTMIKNQSLFTLVLEVGEKQVGQRLSEILTLSSSLTIAEAYEQSIEENQETYFEEIGVSLEPFNTIVQGDLEAQMVLHQNEPNPWNRSTLIQIYSVVDRKVDMVIADANDRIVYRKSMQLTKGTNEIILTDKELNASGIYTYSISDGDKYAVKRMIKIR
jgi:hypothetical protein